MNGICGQIMANGFFISRILFLNPVFVWNPRLDWSSKSHYCLTLGAITQNIIKKEELIVSIAHLFRQSIAFSIGLYDFNSIEMWDQMHCEDNWSLVWVPDNDRQYHRSIVSWRMSYILFRQFKCYILTIYILSKFSFLRSNYILRTLETRTIEKRLSSWFNTFIFVHSRLLQNPGLKCLEIFADHLS